MALIISEGTATVTDDQLIGWRKVTEAVRSAGGQMFIQLMHAGRIREVDRYRE
jgi:N-ethylmaleimide reductase